MKNQNFTATLSVDQTPKAAFAAILNVRGWWSENIEGSTDKRAVWLILDNYFDFTQDRNEWKDTQLIFVVSKNGDNTEIRFTHQGLVPEYECFHVCSNAWGSYINGSLRSLIATGKGRPNQK